MKQVIQKSSLYDVKTPLVYLILKFQEISSVRFGGVAFFKDDVIFKMAAVKMKTVTDRQHFFFQNHCCIDYNIHAKFEYGRPSNNDFSLFLGPPPLN